MLDEAFVFVVQDEPRGFGVGDADPAARQAPKTVAARREVVEPSQWRSLYINHRVRSGTIPTL
jgi:hypothetical protein